MNNKVQQRFDRSIREAVEANRAIRGVPASPEALARRAALRALDEPTPDRTGWTLHLCPVTGATVWGPK
jgi:hypothetical protein